MTAQHLVRVGVLGHVGRFNAADGTRYPRGARVVCRTARGLELGHVLNTVTQPAGDCDGTLVRGVTVQDDLLLTRLAKNRDAAFEACAQLLIDRRMSAVLMEVEHLLDGRGLYFYFLGDVGPELDALTSELAAAYDAKVEFQRFSDALLQGCGPDCGTDAATGCGTGGCSSCSLAAACGVKKV